jgi:hypothetical protein
MALRNDTTFAAAPKTGDGEILGVTATDKIAFYGGVPIAKPTITVANSGAGTAGAILVALGLATQIP